MDFTIIVRDRQNRKYLRECVENGKDVSEKGYCKTCGSYGSLIHTFNMDICECCGERLLQLAESYDITLVDKEFMNEAYIIDLLNEGTIYFDMKKMQDVADKKFGGSINDLVRSYNCPPLNIFPEKINFQSQVTKKGKSRINQLMIDFDGQFTSEKSALALPPDNDGTIAPKMVRGVGLVGGTGSTSPVQSAQPTTTPTASIKSTKAKKQVATQSTKASSTPVAPKSPSTSKNATSTQQVNTVVQQSVSKFGSDFDGEDNIELIPDNKFGIQRVYPANSSDSVLYYDIWSQGELKTDVKALAIPTQGIKTLQDVKSYIQKDMENNPQVYFESFKGISKGIYSIFKYGIYKFALDEVSFTKRPFTLCVVYNDTKMSKTRVYVPLKALDNPVTLSKELTEYMDGIVRNRYPMAVDKNNVIKTSIGLVTFELTGIDKDTLFFDMDMGKAVTKVEIDGNALKGAKSANRVYKETLFANLSKLYSDFKDLKWSKGSFPSATWKTKVNGEDVEVSAQLNTTIYEYEGKLDFLIRIKVNGVTYPKMDGNIYTLGKKDVTFIGFLDKACKDIYDKEVSKGTTNNPQGDMSQSALGKMGNPSRKQALLMKIANKLKTVLTKKGIDPDGGSYDDFSLDLDMQVNNDGNIIRASVSFTDESEEYSDVRDYGTKLGKALQKFGMFKFRKVDTKSSDPTVIFDITDIPKLCDMVDMKVFEGMIREAFELDRNIVSLSESKEILPFI